MLAQRRRHPNLGTVLVTVLLAAAFGCQGETPVTVDEVLPLQAKGGKGGGRLSVDQAIPNWGERTQTLDVEVLGSGYDDGSAVTFKLNGSAAKVRTNSTVFVSGSALVANITVEADADLDLYDVEVMTMRGKKGIGADLFQVVEKGAGPPSGTDPAMFTLGGGDLSSDGNDVYRDGECGVYATYRRGNDLGTLGPTFERARKPCAGPREVTIALVSGHGNPNDPDDHWGDGAVPEVGTLPIGNMKVRLYEDPVGAGTLLVNLPYCFWDQDNPHRPPRGLGLRFNPDFTRDGLRFEHSDYLNVTATDWDGTGAPVAWHVESQESPNNLAGCEKGTDDNPEVEYWHVDVDFDVALVL